MYAISRIDLDDYNWAGGLALIIAVHVLLIVTLLVILIVIPAWRRRRKK